MRFHVQYLSYHGTDLSQTEAQLNSTTVTDELDCRHVASGGAFHF